MLYSVRQLIRDTRTMLCLNAHEHPLFEAHDLVTLTVDQLIAAQIETAARKVVEEAPADLLAPGVPLRAPLSWSGDHRRRIAVMPLPDDCLRLIYIRLSGWHRPATIITDADAAYARLSSPFAGVSGNADRPVAAVTMRPTGRVVELYSSCGDAPVYVEAAQYMPIPRIRDGHLSLPERLYDDVIRRIADQLRSWNFGVSSGLGV